ncbi:MAG TPA: hypothetical protein VF476_16680 [Chitinophagaceae bacterium]
MRTLVLLLFSQFFYYVVAGQHQHGFIRIDAIVSAYFTSDRHFYYNGNDGMYYEIRIGYPINKYFEVNASVGYTERSYIYFAKLSNGTEAPLFMDRYYIPVSANFRLNISDFFYEKLKLWKKQDKWDVYLQLGLVLLKGHDNNDPRESDFQSMGATVPYYKYPYVQSYGNKYPSYLAGVRYNFNTKFGIFIEGGDGSFATLQTGLSLRF